MESTLDCIVCLVRQALDAARMVSVDPAVHESILRDVLRWTANMDLTAPPPRLAQRIHRRLRSLCGNPDPYRAQKHESNKIALALLPDLKKAVDKADDSLDMALRLSLAGNAIDLGVRSSITADDVNDAITDAGTAPLAGNLAAFRRAIASARDILFLADNAGEIVFDRLLIEQLNPERVTVVVRGAPVINDATREDAMAAGIDKRVPVIDNGSDAPGTLLDDCSASFKRRFEAADLIIAKGQGNFESLSTVRKNIFFLFKAKCGVIAAHVGRPQGTHVLTVPTGQHPV